jgi:hypothetical protein
VENIRVYLREEMMGGWKKFHSEELHDLNLSRNTILLG